MLIQYFRVSDVDTAQSCMSFIKSFHGFANSSPGHQGPDPRHHTFMLDSAWLVHGRHGGGAMIMTACHGDMLSGLQAATLQNGCNHTVFHAFRLLPQVRASLCSASWLSPTCMQWPHSVHAQEASTASMYSTSVAAHPLVTVAHHTISIYPGAGHRHHCIHCSIYDDVNCAGKICACSAMQLAHGEGQ